MPYAVSVDLGETLVGFRPRSYEYMLGILKDYGYKIDEKTFFRSLVRVMSKNNFANDEGLNPVNLHDLFYELGIHPCKKIMEEIASRDKYQDYFLYEDAADFLKEIKKKYKVVIVSNSTKRIHKVVKEFKLDRYVDKVIASCDIGIVKPNPKIFSYAKKYVGEIVLHVGDIYELDVIGARRAYIDAVLLDRFNFYPEIKMKAKTLYDVLRYMEIKGLL
ncbi:HAD family hydrolase [Acidianus sp. HS-5]|uniref:HAD family hydrolase n=1 Tax=Acidianus sp. HS-5 TaxID=2886040 RepID=UPI001F263194|nr:HAD family hydrolase [Acidianus sp. HS-5]BDC18940.1 2-haloalkanoic acid dehalogenase [Acidianus sp. HS-5]